MPFKETPEAQAEKVRLQKEAKRARESDLPTLLKRARAGDQISRTVLLRRLRKGQ